MNSAIRKKLLNIHYDVYSLLNRIIPKKKNFIFIYDSQFMRQNCWAFYRYLVEHGYSSKYRIFYYSEKYRDHYGAALKSGVISNPFIGWFLYLFSKYTFYEYHNFKFSCKPGKNQNAVYLTHGMPLKNYGYLIGKPDHPFEDDYTYLLVTSEYFIPIMKKCLGCTDEQVHLGGMPRCDQLFFMKDLDWILKHEKKNILWMPTFRRSVENDINDSSSEFPLLNENNMEALETELEINNINLIIKIHPLQDKIEWLTAKNYRNISVIFNEDLDYHDTELYELIGSVDMLITDYSSVYSDYLLTRKPLAFAIDDLDAYRKNRGFVDKTLIDNLPGPIVDTFEGLIDCMKSIDSIEKDYRIERIEAQKKLSPLPVSKSYSNDLCNFLGITMDV